MILNVTCKGCGDSLQLAAPDRNGRPDQNVWIHQHDTVGHVNALVIQCSNAQCRTFNVAPLGAYVDEAILMSCETQVISGDVPDYLLTRAAEAGIAIPVIGDMTIGNRVYLGVVLFTTWDCYEADHVTPAIFATAA
ncbi:MAG TPA: hypothetical protein VMS08_04795 [Candidatus Saccharimonadia bacterium]|nr:hypothetical protein [Candidatus Saccharimonadia bacterium]